MVSNLILYIPGTNSSAVRNWLALPSAFAVLAGKRMNQSVSELSYFFVSQVWSLSSFEVGCQLLTNDLNQVSSVSLLMTSSTALANEGLFELTQAV